MRGGSPRVSSAVSRRAGAGGAAGGGGGGGQPRRPRAQASRAAPQHVPVPLCGQAAAAGFVAAAAAATGRRGRHTLQVQIGLCSASAGHDSACRRRQRPPPHKESVARAPPPAQRREPLEARACFCMPSVMSTCDRMQLTHMLEGFGEMLMPHRQQSLRVPARAWLREA